MTRRQQVEKLVTAWWPAGLLGVSGLGVDQMRDDLIDRITRLINTAAIEHAVVEGVKNAHKRRRYGARGE